MNRWMSAACRLVEWLMALALLAMVVMVFGNVVLRYAFDSGLTFSEEVSRWLFVWLTFLGAVVELRNHGHLGTDMLVSRLGPKGKRVCLALAQGLMLYITWLLFSGALAQTRINLDVEAPVTGWSMGIFYASGVVFAVASGVILLAQLWRTLTGQLAERDLVMVQESEDLAGIDALHLDPAAPPTSQSFGPRR